MLQDTGAVGHSFPGLRSYITCHYRFADTLAIKRMGNAIVFSKSEARDNVKYFKPHAVFHVCFSYRHKALFLGFFSILSLCLHLLTAGKVRSTVLAVTGTLPVRLAYAWWTAGWSEPSSSHFLSPWLHLPHFTPQRGHSGVRRSVQSFVWNVFAITYSLLYFSE